MADSGERVTLEGARRAIIKAIAVAAEALSERGSAQGPDGIKAGIDPAALTELARAWSYVAVGGDATEIQGDLGHLLAQGQRSPSSHR